MLINKIHAFKENIFNQKKIIFLYSLIILLSLFFILYLANYGFDLTDEGYYLNNFEGKFTSITYFGEIIKPFYFLFNKNIVLLRQANILFAFFIGYLSIYITFKNFKVLSKFLENEKFKTICLIFILSTASLQELLLIKIITPNYNNLCFYGLNLVYISLNFILGNLKNKYLYSIFLISGLTLLIFSKVSSAFIIIFMIFLLSFFKRDSIFITFFSILFSFSIFIFFNTYFYNNNFLDLVFEIKESLYRMSLQGSSHGFSFMIKDSFRLILDIFSHIEYIVFWVLINLYILSSKNVKKKIAYKIASSLALFAIVILYINLKNQIFFFSYYISLPITFLFLRMKNLKIFFNKPLFLSLITLFIPYFYALGTNRSYFLVAKRIPIFFLISSLILLSDFYKNNQEIYSYKKILNFIVITTFISSIIFFQSLAILNKYPYRQPSNLIKYDKKLEIGEGSIVKVSDKTYEYLNKAKKAMFDNTFKKGQTIIDLTGRSPGFIYALNGKPLLAPWILGGYPGSNKLFRYLLDSEKDSNLMNAWILIESGTNQNLEQKYLLEKGIDINNPNQYKLIFKINTTNINPTEKSLKESYQYLFKPL